MFRKHRPGWRQSDPRGEKVRRKETFHVGSYDVLANERKSRSFEGDPTV